MGLLRRTLASCTEPGWPTNTSKNLPLAFHMACICMDGKSLSARCRFPGALIRMWHPSMAPAAWAKAGLRPCKFTEALGNGVKLLWRWQWNYSWEFGFYVPADSVDHIVHSGPNAELTTESDSPWAKLYRNTRTYISWPQPWSLGEVINWIKYATDVRFRRKSFLRQMSGLPYNSIIGVASFNCMYSSLSVWKKENNRLNVIWILSTHPISIHLGDSICMGL